MDGARATPRTTPRATNARVDCDFCVRDASNIRPHPHRRSARARRRLRRRTRVDAFASSRCTSAACVSQGVLLFFPRGVERPRQRLREVVVLLLDSLQLSLHPLARLLRPGEITPQRRVFSFEFRQSRVGVAAPSTLRRGRRRLRLRLESLDRVHQRLEIRLHRRARLLRRRELGSQFRNFLGGGAGVASRRQHLGELGVLRAQRIRARLRGGGGGGALAALLGGGAKFNLQSGGASLHLLQSLRARPRATGPPSTPRRARRRGGAGAAAAVSPLAVASSSARRADSALAAALSACAASIASRCVAAASSRRAIDACCCAAPASAAEVSSR